MSFIQRFLERVLRNNPTRMPRTTFDDLSKEQLDAHLSVGRYGSFSLTDAVRPSIGLEVIPREGYRRDIYCDPESGNKMPVLAASVSSEPACGFRRATTWWWRPLLPVADWGGRSGG